MNRRVRDLWVAALRSDGYAQGTGALGVVFANGVVLHCCLGVLCELAVAEGVIRREERTTAVADVGRLSFGDMTKFPPEAVVEWAGLGSSNPIVTASRGERVTLGRLNDAFEWSFGQIADAIEEEL